MSERRFEDIINFLNEANEQEQRMIDDIKRIGEENIIKKKIIKEIIEALNYNDQKLEIHGRELATARSRLN